MPTDKRVTQAIERLRLASEADEKQRRREKDALAFQVPDEQWPAEARKQREAQIIGGVTLPAQPMLAIPKLDQPIQLVLNQEKAADLGVQVHALSEDATDDTAEVLQGLYRCIERESRANLARSWAFERAVKAGRGAYRVLTEYDPSAPKGTNYQRIVIKRILFQDSVYFDPFAIEPDSSDGEWAFVVSWVQWSKYQRIYKGKTAKDADNKDVKAQLAEYTDTELTELVTTCPEWVKGEGEKRAVLVAEYFCIEGDGDDRKVIWRKMNGVEILEQQTWPGKYIPIIPVIGRELIPFDDERRWMGIYEPNKDGQRLFNYAASTAVAAASQEPKATWIMAEGQEEGHEQEFALAHSRPMPYVRYKPTRLGDELNPPPTRSQTDTTKLGLSIQMLSMAGDFLHAGTGAFEPTLGQNSPNVRTKGQTLALQQQHDEGNSNWLDNLKEITMAYEALVVIDLMKWIYGEPGRVARLLDIEDNPSMAMLNAPFMLDPKTKRPIPAPQQAPALAGQPGAVLGLQAPNPDKIKHYDLKQGTYGFSISVGKGFKTRLDEGNDALGNLFQAEPQLFSVLGDIWLEFQSWPGHKQAAERVKKMLPPQLQEHDDQNAEMELQQAKAALQAQGAQLQEMAKALETDQVRVQGDIEKAKIKAATDLQLQEMRDATSIAVAEINAAVKGLAMQSEALNEAQATGRQHAFEADQAAKDRAHEVATGALAAQQQSDASSQDAGQTAALADQAHGQALEQGAAGHDQAMAQAQQAADLAPPPAEGSGA